MEGQGVKPKCVWGLRVPKGVAGVIGKLPWGRFAAVTIAVGCLGAVGATGAAAAGGGVLKVRLGGDQTETRIVIDLDRAASGKLANDPGAPRQVVLNLPGVNVDGDLQGSGLGLVKAWTVERTATCIWTFPPTPPSSAASCCRRPTASPTIATCSTWAPARRCGLSLRRSSASPGPTPSP
jgi:hypothetical protein